MMSEHKLATRGASITLGDGIKVLENAGMKDQLEPNLLRGKRMTGSTKDGKELFSMDFDEEALKKPHVKAFGNIGRPTLQRVLFDSLNKNTVQFGKRLETINEDEEHVFLEFADGSKAGPFDCVVGADGIHSKVGMILEPTNSEATRTPDSSSLQGHSKYTGITIIGAEAFADTSERDVDYGQLNEQVYSEYIENDGTTTGVKCIYKASVEDGKVREHINFSYRDAQPNSFAWEAKGGRDHLQTIVDSYEGHPLHSRMTALVTRAKDEDIFKWGVWNRDAPSKTWISKKSGRICILGDAAHAMSPFLGEGANQALLDAECLALQLTDTNPQSVSKSLRQYESIRKPKVEIIMSNSEFNGLLNTASGQAAQVRNELLIPFFQTVGVRNMFGPSHPLHMLAKMYFNHRIKPRFFAAERASIKKQI